MFNQIGRHQLAGKPIHWVENSYAHNSSSEAGQHFSLSAFQL
jgi:hypothetical protein